jgi:hypothetical protein
MVLSLDDDSQRYKKKQNIPSLSTIEENKWNSAPLKVFFD